MTTLSHDGAETYAVNERADRTTRHVRLEAKVEGVPEIRKGEGLVTRYPIAPNLARVTYVQVDGGPWRITATVYGRQTAGFSLMNGWAEYVYRSDSGTGAESWPDWLRALADQEHPDRPGGWPGDDPEGSYL